MLLFSTISVYSNIKNNSIKDKIQVKETSFTIKITDFPTSLKREEEYQLNTEIFGNYIENEKVKWSISNNTSSDTKISDAGYLTITKDENSKKYSLQRKRQMDIKTQLQ